MFVKIISNKYTHEWLLNKHYAKRIPPIIYSFGLYFNNLEGVCTYGPPPRMYNKGNNIFKNKIKIDVFELNRLCINDNLPKNTLSYFVSQTFKLFPVKPSCLISYADSNMGHSGYIYQATNWIYTGITNDRKKFLGEKGNEIHERTLYSKYGETTIDVCKKNNIKIISQKGKHRYVHFVGSKNHIKYLKNNFNLNTLSYPKGNNKRYDSSYKIKQTKLSNFLT